MELESFEIVGEIHAIETIATGHAIRDLRYLEERFGHGSWRKLKGFATRMVRLLKLRCTGTKLMESASDG